MPDEVTGAPNFSDAITAWDFCTLFSSLARSFELKSVGRNLRVKLYHRPNGLSRSTDQPIQELKQLPSPQSAKCFLKLTAFWSTKSSSTDINELKQFLAFYMVVK